jgi:uncharacterized protein YecE (DUF72 family)
MAIHVGCGSWADKDYVGLLYPKTLPATARLSAYTQWFERVELNATYHAIPPRERIAAWVAQTPADFRFDVKLTRSASENPGSAAALADTDRLLASLAPIIERHQLGAFLLTLDPSFGPGRHALDELAPLAEKLRPYAPVAVELRDRAWVDGNALAPTLATLRTHQLAWVALDLPSLHAAPLLPPIDEVTLPALAYMRLHGRNPDYLKPSKDPKARHRHDYTASELSEIAARIRSLAARAKDVHVSVNNHYADFAPKAALALRRLLGQPVPSSPPPSDDESGQRSLFD